MYNEGINHLYVCPIAVDSVFNARKTGMCGNRETSYIGYGLVRRDLHVGFGVSCCLCFNLSICVLYIHIYVCMYIKVLFYMSLFFFLLALQPPLGVVFYSPLVGFSLLAYEVS